MLLEPLEDSPGVCLVPSRRQRPDKAIQTALFVFSKKTLSLPEFSSRSMSLHVRAWWPSRRQTPQWSFLLTATVRVGFVCSRKLRTIFASGRAARWSTRADVVVVRGPRSLNAPGSTIDFIVSPPLIRGIPSRVCTSQREYWQLPRLCQPSRRTV